MVLAIFTSFICICVNIYVFFYNFMDTNACRKNVFLAVIYLRCFVEDMDVARLCHVTETDKTLF